MAYNTNIDELLPSDLLSDDEVVVFAIKPSIWTVVFLSFRTVLVFSLVAVVTLLFGSKINLGSYGSYIILACGLIVIGRVGFAFLQWLSRTYILTDRRVIRIRGVFTIDIFQCALVKIQNTFLVLTLPQRILRLGSIAFTTAGTAGIEAIWRHCEHPLQIHHQLLRTINAAANLLPKDTQKNDGL